MSRSLDIAWLAREIGGRVAKLLIHIGILIKDKSGGLFEVNTGVRKLVDNGASQLLRRYANTLSQGAQLPECASRSSFDAAIL